MAKANVQPGGDPLNPVSKQALHHGSIKQHGHDAAVKPVRIALIIGIAGKAPGHAAVRLLLKTQAEPVEVSHAAHKAGRMAALPQRGGPAG